MAGPQTPPEVTDAEKRRDIGELIRYLTPPRSVARFDLAIAPECAAWALARVGDKRALAALRDLASRRPQIQGMAGPLPYAEAAELLALRLKGDEASLRELARLVVEGPAPMPWPAARVLACVDQPLALELLEQARQTLLAQGGPEDALRAALPLARTKSPGSEAAIENVLMHAEGSLIDVSYKERCELQDAWWDLKTVGMDEQQRIAAYLGELDRDYPFGVWRKLSEAGEAARPALLGIIADETKRESDRGAAAGMLDAEGVRQDEGELLRLLNDRTKGCLLRWPCAMSLLESGSEKGLAAVVATLRDPNEDVALLRTIPGSISKCTRPRLEDALTGLLAHPDIAVCMGAAGALNRGGTGAFIDRAVELISGEGVAEERRSVLDQVLANSAKHWTGPAVALRMLALKPAPLARAAAATYLGEHRDGAAHADAIKAAILAEANEDALKAEVSALKQLRGDEGLDELRAAADGLEGAAKEALLRAIGRAQEAEGAP